MLSHGWGLKEPSLPDPIGAADQGERGEKGPDLKKTRGKKHNFSAY